MRMILGTLAALAVLSISHLALADEAKGTVETMDVQTRTITLDDGNTYVVGDGVALEVLRPGAEVTVSYEMKGNERKVMEIKPSN